MLKKILVVKNNSCSFMYEKELVYKIRGAVFDIYNNVTGNWKEEVYEDILFDALSDNGLKVERQKEFEVFYKGNRIGLYRTDLIVEDKIILELKAVPEVFPLHEAQTISYLKISGLQLALLINFGGAEVRRHRLVARDFLRQPDDRC